MKNSILLTGFFVVLGTFAQSPDMKILKEGVMMRDGKMMLINKDGIIEPMESDQELSGTTINKSGDVKLDNGYRTKLKNGEVITRKGVLLSLADMYITAEGFIYKDKKMWKYTQGVISELKADETLTNGCKISLTGLVSYVGEPLMEIQLKDGERLNVFGDLIRRKEEMYSFEGVMKRDEKLYRYTNGKMSLLLSDFNFPVSNRVSTEGTVTFKDGNSITLTDGEYISTKCELLFSRSDFASTVFTKRDGSMIRLENNKLVALKDTIQLLKNGMMLHLNGLITHGDTNKVLLREGDMVTPEGLIYISKGIVADAKSLEEKRLVDHIVLRHNKVLMVFNGEPSMISKDITLTNGFKVSKHGHITKLDGKKITMKDGDRYTLSGVLMTSLNSVVAVPVETPKVLDTKVSGGDIAEKGYIVMRGSQVFLVKNMTSTPLDADVILANFSRVSKKGQVEKEDGSKFMLKPGDRISITGVMLAKEGKTENSEYFIMKSGKLYLVRADKEIIISKEVNVPTGLSVFPNGEAKTKDGKKIQLKDGEKIDLKGEYIK